MALLWLLCPPSFTCHWPRALTVLHSTSSLSYHRPLSHFPQRCDFDRFHPPQSGLLQYLPGWLAGWLDGELAGLIRLADQSTLTHKKYSIALAFPLLWHRPWECPISGVPNPPWLRNTTNTLEVFCTDRHVLARLLASLPYHGPENSADMPDALGPRILDRFLRPWT